MGNLDFDKLRDRNVVDTMLRSINESISFTVMPITIRADSVFTDPQKAGKRSAMRLASFTSPVTINSGCRCQGYNRGIGGAKKSQHMLGRAADISVVGVDPVHVADYAESVGVPGVGRYKTFTHVDSRSGMARWVG